MRVGYDCSDTKAGSIGSGYFLGCFRSYVLRCSVIAYLGTGEYNFTEMLTLFPVTYLHPETSFTPEFMSSSHYLSHTLITIPCPLPPGHN